MSQERQDSAKDVRAAFEAHRQDLSPEEALHFDKLVSLIEDISFNETPRILALDAVLILALATIALHPLVVHRLIQASVELLPILIMHDRLVKTDPRFNQ